MYKQLLSKSSALAASRLPLMPPVVSDFVDAAPEPLKAATALACLSPLGALTCQLEAEYLDGEVQTPIFQTNVRAPQASGKGKLGKVIERILEPIDRSEEEQIAVHQDWLERVKAYRAIEPKATLEEIYNIFGEEPIPIIRDLGSKVSTTAMLEVTSRAKGLSVILCNNEADSLVKSWSSNNTDISDMLRIGWDGDRYKQHMASVSKTFSGNVRLRIGTALCGTSDAYDRLFKNQVNGAISRQLFVWFPNLMFEPLQKWHRFTHEENEALTSRLQLLSEVSLKKTSSTQWEVQPRHRMNLDYVNNALAQWLEAERLRAKAENNVTRGTFYKRAAVMGFRAAILAHYLWGEPAEKGLQESICDFACCVADMALLGLLKYYSLPEDAEGNFLAKNAYCELDQEFTTDDLTPLLKLFELRSRPADVVDKWKRKNLITDTGRTVTTPAGTRKRVYSKVNPQETTVETQSNK